MKKSVQTYKNGTNVWDTYNKVMDYFATQFLNLTNEEEGREFMDTFALYLDDSKFPCDQIVLNCFTGYDDIFGMEFKYNRERIAYIQIKTNRYGIMKIYSKSYEKKDLVMFHHILEEFFNNLNEHILFSWMSSVGLEVYSEDNEVEIDNYVNYELKSSEVFKGTIEEIFEKYTTINDRYKYCNGHYISFHNPKMRIVYKLFTQCYNGNYFLDNAVKRGVIID